MSERLLRTEVVEKEKRQYDRPLVLCGFVGPGLVSVAAIDYVIEKLGLHQVGYLRSRLIPPVAVFMREKLRRAFRIYADEPGKLLVVVCEVPLTGTGLYEISSSLLDWLEQIGAKEIVVLDGVPVKEIPRTRQVFYAADEEMAKDLKRLGLQSAGSLLIGGMPGSVLNESLGRKVVGMSLLTPVSVSLPDPGAVLAMIRAVNSVCSLTIPTADLEKNVAELKAYFKALSSQHRKMKQEAAKQESLGSMYA